MVSIASGAGGLRPNHPKAVLMALIAFLSFNIGMGSIMGTPGVLMSPMARRLAVPPEWIPWALLAVLISSAIVGPQIGALAVRRSLRGLLVAGALLLAGAWLILAFTASYLVYLAVYAFLLGPAMVITGSVLAPTLVTRWFHHHRGLAIGLVHMTILLAVMPVATAWLIVHIGLQSTFLVLAVLPLLTLLPAAFLIVDWPHESPTASPITASPTADPAPDHAGAHMGAAHMGIHGPSFTLLQILRQPRFWALTLAIAMPNTSSMLLTQHLVTIAGSWGVSPVAAAGLASAMSLGGIIGTVVLGFVADRIGGARVLAVITACGGGLWLLFLARASYAGLAVIVVSIGMFGSGAIPAMSKAYADAFGRASVSRAIGLMLPATLPITAIGLIGPSIAVRAWHSYTPVILGMAGGLILAALSACWAARKA